MADRVRARMLVPEVVQTSAMDCGPASLKCLLEGYGVHASYGRLREACQTDVDGTSIDTIEDVAVQLGLQAEQIMVPVDHVLVPEPSILPAIAVVRLPSGLTHFVVAWRRHGGVVQVMDPAIGRRWLSRTRFLNDLYVHETTVAAAAWLEWASGADALATVRRRLADDGIAGAPVARLLERAAADPDWRTLAAADAAGRMTAALRRSGAIARGAEAARLFERFYEGAREGTLEESIVPRTYWSVWPAAPDADGADQVRLRGAVLVTVRGLDPERRAKSGGRSSTDSHSTNSAKGPLSRELVAALDEPPVRAWRTLLDLLRADGAFVPALLLAALGAAAAGVIVEALLFRAILDVGFDLTLTGQRAAAAAVLMALVVGLLLLEVPIASAALRLGRRVEARLRIAFLEKIPRLGDRYFHSRPSSDMAERSHSIHQIRLLPDLTAQLLRAVFELLLTTAAIAWIDPPSAPIAIVSAAFALALPFAMQPVLRERDLRVRTHAGALGRFYLDAFLGLVASRTHGAERALRREHESVLVEWARAGFGLQRAAVAIEGAQLVAGFGLAAWLLWTRLDRGAEPGTLLLLTYWALNLPVLGQQIAQLAWQYPAHRNVLLRLLEPLGALDDAAKTGTGDVFPETGTGDVSAPGVAIVCDEVSVVAGGHPILQDITLRIASGSHVAIVGPSGAGKSSLVGLLLGWHRAAHGRVTVDEAPLDAAVIERLRGETAWVDPAVHLWNRSLLDNLLYGTDGSAERIGPAIHAADLRDLLEKLPDGLQTALGESGGSISGGEGQRVRLGRALLRPDARLVILDEPFRGLERERRRDLLRRARGIWRRATLLCITHDVSETLAFDRVLVVGDGRVVEDGQPATLAALPGSHYRAMLDADTMVREGLWTRDRWRILTLEHGRVADQGEEAAT